MRLINQFFVTVFIIALSVDVASGQLVAGFSATPVAGCQPLVVAFTNTTTPSTGTTYTWDLGNGTGIITLTNPGTSYLSAGTYTVTLTATNGSSSSIHKQVITVYPSPSVNFTASDTAVCPHSPVTFTSSTSSGVPGPLTYLWSFGDGVTATTATCPHAFSFPGHFNITLNATNADGCSSSLTKPNYVYVYTPPSPAFTVNSNHFCHVPGNAVFSAAPVGLAPFIYSWNFGDGSPPSSLPGPSHTYTATGNYTALLTLTDGRGCTDTNSGPGHILAGNFKASISAPDTACRYNSVTFDNSSSPHISSLWNFGDGYTDTNNTGHHVYIYPGTYNVQLVVFDGTCYDTTVKPLVIHTPVTTFSMTPAYPCPPPVTTTFTAPAIPGSTVTWHLADTLPLLTGTQVAHTFTSVGFYPVTMVLTTDAGCKDTVTQEYRIFDLIFRIINGALFTSDTTGALGGCVPHSVHFKTQALTTVPGPGSTDYPYAPYTYLWSFGDGATSTLDSPVHPYTVEGLYNVHVTFTSANGCIAHDSAMAGAGARPSVTFDATPNHACFDHNDIHFTRTVISGHPNLSLWLFGEGLYGYPLYDTNAAPVVTVAHQFTLPGIFSDTLISFNNGCPDTFIRHDYIRIDSPKAIVHPNAYCSPPNTVLFTNNSLGENSRIWMFGDGTTSTLAAPTHTYPASSVYTVQFIDSNFASGCRDTAQFTVNLSRPVMAFGTTDTAICANQYVIINSSVISGIANYYQWFAGGVSSEFNSFNFIDTFHSPGSYTVMLVIHDQNNCPDTTKRINYITVAKPVAHFSVTPANVCLNNPAVFTDTSTDVPGAFIASHIWTFGDGSVATTGAPAIVHAYSLNGVYSIKEIITDNLGCKDSLTGTTVNVSHPFTSFTASTTAACAHTSVNFNSLSSAGVTYLWSFGDGATATVVNPAHAYTDTGTYTVRLVVTDIHGCHDTATHSNSVTISKPHAVFHITDSVSICPPFVTTFTNSSTGASSYKWFFGNGDSSVAFTPSVIYNSPGYNTVTLVAIDAAGCRDTTTNQHVKIYGYAGSFSYGPYSGCVPDTVLFNADLSNVSGVSSIIWDFSDGVTSAASLSDTITHAYVTPGSFVPKLIITDHSGCMSSNLGLDTIKTDGIVAGFNALPNPICEDDTLLLTDTSRSYRSHIALSQWTYRGVTQTNDSTYYLCSIPGTDTVILVVTDSQGCNARATSVVTVNPLPVAGQIKTTLVNDFCIGLTFKVSDTVAGGIWHFSNSHVSITGDSITAESPGTDTLYYSVTNGCGTAVAVDTFRVPPPLPAISGRLNVCAGDTIVLSDSLFGGMWRGGNAHVYLSASLQDSGLVAGVSAGTAIITYEEDLGCYTTTTVTVDAVPVVDSIISPVTCYGYNNGKITLIAAAAGIFYTYYWNINKTGNTIDSLQPGMYTVLITDSLTTCTLKRAYIISEPDSLMATGKVTEDICQASQGSIELTVSGGKLPYSYHWSNNTDADRINGVTGGEYYAIISDSNTCTKKVTFVVPDSCEAIIIHNAVSPNGDGINDTWVIEGLKTYIANTVQVFDKWGDEVFSATNYQNDWGGTGRKGTVPDGTYYYVVKLNSPAPPGGRDSYTGYLIIKR